MGRDVTYLRNPDKNVKEFTEMKKPLNRHGKVVI